MARPCIFYYVCFIFRSEYATILYYYVIYAVKLMIFCLASNDKYNNILSSRAQYFNVVANILIKHTCTSSVVEKKKDFSRLVIVIIVIVAL